MAACKIPHFKLSQIQDETRIEDITCGLCESAVNIPIEILPCKCLVCCNCCLGLLTQMSFHCPGCSKVHDVSVSSFSRLSPIVENMLYKMMVRCECCLKNVRLELSDKGCDLHVGERDNPVTLEEVVNLPLDQQDWKNRLQSI